MLPDDELTSLMLNLESDRVERKASTSDEDKIRRTICAFANDLPDHQEPGLIFIGVDDKTAACNPAFQISDNTLRTLAGMKDDGRILPLPTIEVDKRTLSGCEVAVIQVAPSQNPPIRYNGITWVRVGPSTRRVSAEEERRLSEKRRAGDLSFDLQPARGSTLDDLDLDLFRNTYLPAAVAPEVLAENQRTITQQLAALRFLSREGLPTNGSILVLGRDQRTLLPGAYIQFRRVDGNDLVDPTIDSKVLAGPLPQLLPQLDDLLRANLAVTVDVSGPRELRQADYPYVALRELTRNAVLHRIYEATNAPIRLTWYADRVEIDSPGGPYGMVNERNFGQPGLTDYRNPLLAEAMGALGYVQRYGFGIYLAQRELASNGNPPAEFTVDANGVGRVLTTIRRRP